MKSDHVVFDGVIGQFECNYCGQSYKPVLPCPIGKIIAKGKEFFKAHKHCKPKEEDNK